MPSRAGSLHGIDRLLGEGAPGTSFCVACCPGGTSEVPALDQVMAEAAGILRGRTRTSDVIDASMVLTARRERAVVVTSDVGDLDQFDPDLLVERI
jgi:hypothetical protein